MSRNSFLEFKDRISIPKDSREIVIYANDEQSSKLHKIYVTEILIDKEFQTPLTLHPYDLTFDHLKFRFFVKKIHTKTTSVYLNGILATVVSIQDQIAIHNNQKYTLCEAVFDIEAPHHEKIFESQNLLFINNFGSEIDLLFTNASKRREFVSEFVRKEEPKYKINFRQLQYFLIFPQLFLAPLALILLTDTKWLNAPQSLLVSAFPLVVGLIGEKYSKIFTISFLPKGLFYLQLRYKIFSLLGAGLVVLGVTTQYEKLRCDWIEYAYNEKYQKFLESASTLVDPVEELAELVSIAPDRKENLFLFQHVLWRSRYDDAFARVVNANPQGFKRPGIAHRFLTNLSPSLISKLKEGDQADCGCVSKIYQDDPRLLWIFAKEESLGAITTQNKEVFKELALYSADIHKNTSGSSVEFQALSERYWVVYHSHKQGERVNNEHRDSLKRLEECNCFFVSNSAIPFSQFLSIR